MGCHRREGLRCVEIQEPPPRRSKCLPRGRDSYVITAVRILVPILKLHLAAAGQDATDAFYGLHRHEVLLKPQYARLQIGIIAGEKSQIVSNVPGELSEVPYAEPTWLSKGYHSPYYKEVCSTLYVL